MDFLCPHFRYKSSSFNVSKGNYSLYMRIVLTICVYMYYMYSSLLERHPYATPRPCIDTSAVAIYIYKQQ